MKTFSEYINELNIDTPFHKYSKNTIEELELLLKHHKEDLKEIEAEGPEDKEEILKDIKEIEAAIRAKSTNESTINKVSNKPTVNNVKKLIKNLDFSVIMPEYFDVSEHKYSGGGKGVKVQWDKAPRSKDEDDIKLMIDSVMKGYARVDYKQGDSYLMVLAIKV